MGNFGFSELALIGVIIVFLFGSKKIPELAKGLAEGLRIFKSELNQPSSPNPEPPPKDSKKE